MGLRSRFSTVVRHDRNLGKGQALRTGLATVLSQPFTHVVFLDADLQHDPGEIPRLLDYVSQGLDSFTSKPSFSIAAVTAVRGSVPSSARAEIAAIAMLSRSTSKNFRNAMRVSLRPKPSVPRAT